MNSLIALQCGKFYVNQVDFMCFYFTKEMYVGDEIVTAASGVRIRVINTDAEGRFAMADPLFHMKEEVNVEACFILKKCHKNCEQRDLFLRIRNAAMVFNRTLSCLVSFLRYLDLCDRQIK